MRSLLDNRKDLTPQQSMDNLVKYARKQDTANLLRRIRSIRAEYFFGLVFIGGLTAYVIKQYTLGYWPSIYPRNLISSQVEIAGDNKRLFFTPEIYLKDYERWNRDLLTKDLRALKQNPDHHEGH